MFCLKRAADKIRDFRFSRGLRGVASVLKIFVKQLWSLKKHVEKQANVLRKHGILVIYKEKSGII